MENLTNCGNNNKKNVFVVLSSHDTLLCKKPDNGTRGQDVTDVIYVNEKK